MDPPQNLTIVQIIAICRHGARTHLKDVSEYFESTMIDKKGFKKGQLTPSGFVQLFHLGKKIKSEYPQFFEGGYNHNKHFFKSSNIPRTIQSSIGLFQGLFDIHKLPELDQPFSHPNSLPPWPGIDAFDESEIDFSLDLRIAQKKPEWLEVTPDIKQEYELRTHVTPEYKRLIDYYKGDIKEFVEDVYQSSPFQKYIEKVDEYSLKEIDLEPLELLQDTDFFLSELKNNPECEYKEDFIENVKLVNHGKHFKRYVNPIGNKALCSPLICYLIKLMEDKIQVGLEKAPFHKPSAPHKDQIIEAGEEATKGYEFASLLTHDTVITPMLINFDVGDIKSVIDTITEGEISKDYLPKPPFASSVIFELLVDDKGVFFVRFRYNGEYLDFCKKVKPEDEYFTISFDEFKEYVFGMIFEDWKHFLENFDKDEEYGLMEEEEEEIKKELEGKKIDDAI